MPAIDASFGTPMRLESRSQAYSAGWAMMLGSGRPPSALGQKGTVSVEVLPGTSMIVLLPPDFIVWAKAITNKRLSTIIQQTVTYTYQASDSAEEGDNNSGKSNNEELFFV